jgi:PhnB protein
MKLNVHLVFPGTCEEAFNFYKEVLNGEITFLFRKKEDKSLQLNEVEEEKISHMILSTEYFNLGAEDAAEGEAVATGSNCKLVLVFTDIEKLRRVFDLLSQGGEVVAPLEKTFFCDAFGELIDKYGVRWLIMMDDEGYSA